MSLYESSTKPITTRADNAYVSAKLLHRLVLYHRKRTPKELRRRIMIAATSYEEAEAELASLPEPEHDWLIYWRQQFLDCTRPDPETKNPFWWREIIKQVLEQHGVTEDQVFSAKRHYKIVNARNEIYYRIRRETILSLPEIGRRLGRDHSTVLHGLRKHCERHNLPIPGGKTS